MGVYSKRRQARCMDRGTAAASWEKMSAATTEQTEEIRTVEKEVAVPNTIDFSDRCVELHVGSPEIVLRIHEKVPLRSPRYLKSEIETFEVNPFTLVPRVILARESVETVSVYLHWLYTGLFSDILGTKVLAESYLFGERIKDTSYKNAVLKEFAGSLETSKTSELEEATQIIYEGTAKGSKARRFIVDLAINQACPEWKFMLSSCSKDLLVDILEVLLKDRTASNAQSWVIDISKYLENESDS